MKVRDIVKLTNTYLAGEQLVYQKLIPFYDAVIDEINSRLNSTYPSFSSLEFTSLEGDDAVYDYFPDKYIRSVVALGAAHKFYEMDEEGKLTFYMHGARQGHKVDLVKADGRAFIEIDTDEELMYSDIACDNGATYSSVMARGNVTLLEDPAEKVKGLKALMKLQTGKDFEIRGKNGKMMIFPNGK